MSIRSQVAADWKANVDADGEDVTLINGENEYAIHGFVFRVTERIDPETGVKIADPHTSVSVPLADLPSVPDEDWEVQTTDVTGDAISGKVCNVRPDYTLGCVTFDIELFTEVVSGD